MKSILAVIFGFATLASAHATPQIVCGNKTFVQVFTTITNDGEQTILMIESENGWMDWQHSSDLSKFTGKPNDKGLLISEILVTFKTSECPIAIDATATQNLKCSAKNARIDLVGEGEVPDNDGSGGVTYTKKFPALNGGATLDFKMDPAGIQYKGQIVNPANGLTQAINVFGDCHIENK